MLETLLDLLGAATLRLLAWGIVLLISWAVATPVILVAALFGSKTYRRNVRAGYRAIYDFWEHF